MTGVPEIISPPSFSTCLRGELIANAVAQYGIDGAARILVVSSLVLYQAKCELELFGICSLPLSREEG